MVIAKKENLKFWEQPVAEEEKTKQLSFEKTPLDDAEQVANETLQAIDFQGFCLWRCTLLRGEIMMLVRNDLSENIETRYPLYTLEELEMMDELPASTIRLIYHIKKKSGDAVIISVEQSKYVKSRSGV